jgi:hypothetical protein
MTIGDLELEAYPNRDSMPYQELYGLDDARTMFRGTLRYPGWSVMMRNMVKIGFLTEDVHDELSGKSYRDLTAALAGVPGEDLQTELAGLLGIAADSETMKRIEWLGLLSDRPLDPDSPLKPIEQLGSLMVDLISAPRPCSTTVCPMETPPCPAPCRCRRPWQPSSWCKAGSPRRASKSPSSPRSTSQ